MFGMIPVSSAFKALNPNPIMRDSLFDSIRSHIIDHLTISQSMLLKNGWPVMASKPVSLQQPSRSSGFLFRKPFRTEAAFTDRERGIRIVFSKITATGNDVFRKAGHPRHTRAKLFRRNDQQSEISNTGWTLKMTFTTGGQKLVVIGAHRTMLLDRKISLRFAKSVPPTYKFYKQ